MWTVLAIPFSRMIHRNDKRLHRVTFLYVPWRMFDQAVVLASLFQSVDRTTGVMGVFSHVGGRFLSIDISTHRLISSTSVLYCF